MARRARGATQAAAPDEAAAAAAASPAESMPEAGAQRFVMFRVAGELYGFALAEVAEIIRPPALARMPLAPPSLLGLANLRGAVLPVVGARSLLGLPETQADAATRIIVVNQAVGFVVDRVENLVAVGADRLETAEAGAGAVDPGLLDGVIKGREGDGTIRILSPKRLLGDAFARLGARHQRPRSAAAAGTTAAITVATEQRPKESLVSFELGRQEYALPLDRVREIIPVPENVSEVPRAETAVLGVVTLRDRLLPLVSLRALLGLPAEQRSERGKVVVLSIGNATVGMVADRTREILRVDPDLIEPAPALLTRGAGEAEITSICRLEAGKRLVAVLSPDRLFRSDLVRRVLAEQSESTPADTDEITMADEQFIIFRLGDQDFGLPIAAVDEIARPPERITRLPKAPAFIDGVMNLRGSVVPIVDLRRRFALSSVEPGRAQRILVLAIGAAKTGFMVDGVSEVMRVPEAAIAPAPEFSAEQLRLIGRVANLEGRMILLVDPAQLLDQVEADVLAKFDPTGASQTARTS
jgi:purine-binding chemotaxis protein CheW